MIDVLEESTVLLRFVTAALTRVARYATAKLIALIFVYR